MPRRRGGCGDEKTTDGYARRSQTGTLSGRGVRLSPVSTKNTDEAVAHRGLRPGQHLISARISTILKNLIYEWSGRRDFILSRSKGRTRDPHLGKASLSPCGIEYCGAIICKLEHHIREVDKIYFARSEMSNIGKANLQVVSFGKSQWVCELSSSLRIQGDASIRYSVTTFGIDGVDLPPSNVSD